MGEIIGVKNRFVVPLYQLARLALRYVYDREGMNSSDIGIMQRSIVFWHKKINKTEAEEDTLMRIGKFLQKDSEGKLEKRKELFSKHGINWAKFHRTPDLTELGEK